MRSIGFFICLFVLVPVLKAQEVTFIKAEQITAWKKNTSDTIYIINFWATWCKPCLEEMPSFEKIGEEFKDKKVRVLLVSNDFKKQIDLKLKPYMLEKGIRNKMYWMNESDPNKWIELVDPHWGGSLPATLIIKGSEGKSKFFAGPLSYEELKDIILQMKP
jgi:thiol-disulfide isomerase/thioredoxin